MRNIRADKGGIYKYEKAKKYRTIDFLIIPIRYTPLQSAFTILYTIFDALMPAYQTIALANFINCVIEILSRNRKQSDIIFPIILIAIYIMFMNLMPSIANIINLTGRNKLTLKLKNIILNKKTSLEYMHIENTDTQELINRVCSDTVGCFSSGFNNILSATRLIISSLSLLIIIMTATIISGIIIVAVSVPLIFVAMRTGKRNYEMSKEAKKIQRKYSYLSSILTGREYAGERTLF